MDGPMWSRLGAASGMLFVVLLLGGESIPLNDGVVEFVGLVLFIPFVGYLFSVLRRAEGGDGWLSATALGAGMISSAMKLASGGEFVAARGVQGVGGTRIEDVLVAMNDGSFMAHMAPLGVMVGAASAVIIRTRVLPVWLGWAGALTACALLVNSTFVEAEFGLAFMFFMLWTVVTSAIMTRRAGAGRMEGATGSESIRPKPVR